MEVTKSFFFFSLPDERGLKVHTFFSLLLFVRCCGQKGFPRILSYLSPSGRARIECEREFSIDKFMVVIKQGAYISICTRVFYFSFCEWACADGHLHSVFYLLLLWKIFAPVKWDFSIPCRALSTRRRYRFKLLDAPFSRFGLCVSTTIFFVSRLHRCALCALFIVVLSLRIFPIPRIAARFRFNGRRIRARTARPFGYHIDVVGVTELK